MRLFSGPRACEALFVFLLAICSSSRAVTLDDLRAAPGLTPQKFASYFSEFEFKFHNEIQDANLFLASQSGDCDDYAILASKILRERGYTPRLVTVRMPKVIHVVCYIEETGTYLDYNNRNCLKRTVSSPPEIAEIAARVAKSYHTRWSSASEFTYEDGAKRLVQTVVDSKKSEGLLATIFH